MKRIIYLIVVFFCLFGSNAMAQIVKHKVAVYVTGEADNGYKKVLGSKLVTGITRSENYSAVERTADFLAELNKEQDYQMSGAVSDNQIVRLGAQFGVRYVLVADVSEVFESMFISARMIDVQTAQITNSTESSGGVNSMEDLTKLADNIVLYLFYAKEYAKDEIKILGPFSTVRDLCSANAPDGYHIATKEEMEEIIKNNNILNKKTSVPIYAELKSGSSLRTQFFTVEYYDKKGRGTNKYSLSRFYSQCDIYCVFIEDLERCSNKQFSFISDPDYVNKYTLWNDGSRTSGLYNMSTNPSITSGYVYLIKDKEDNKSNQ